jgi:two-component system, NtrC family, sensor kinase
MAYKILWIDDDNDVLDSARRLFRSTQWELVTVAEAQAARDAILRENFAVIVADQRLQAASGVDLLEFAKEKAPAASRILLTGNVELGVIEEAVNRGHVFRFVSKPWDNEQLLVDILKAIDHHQLKMTQTGLLKEVSSQNRQLERLTSGLEQLVSERTTNVESSKDEAEKKLSHVRELVRFIKDLSNLTSVDELLNLIRKELKSFHELRAPALAYVVADRTPIIIFFQGKQVVEREARQMWSPRPRMRINEHEDRVYLANEFGRPFVKVLAIPLKRRAIASESSGEAPATLFFEHALPDEKIDQFLSFISERLQPLSIALDRILLEYHLKWTSVQWEGTFDGIKDPIAIVDIDFMVVRANRHFAMKPNAERGYEFSCHKVFANSDLICRGCPVALALETGLPQRGQVRRGTRVYDVLSYPIRLNDDHISTNVINHYVDVTASRELHGRMIQSEKMAAVGLLAGNIAHELNNPLTGIRSLAQVLMAEVPKNGTLHDDILEVEKAAERSQKIIENLLGFSKGESDQKQVLVSLNEIVRRTLPMLKTAMREHRSEILLAPEEPMVKVEPHLMQQVVFNLVNNACQAMADAGVISIETSNNQDEEGKSWSIVQVTDTGSGIPADIIESIFEPFFTTKEKGQGTGLGLSMSQSVIQNFGGEIRVTSKVGEGTRFSVRLPVVP